jgi:16S rRNA (adenine1518-N6/adenine1519-N6)-dimethyltransferase
MTHPKHILHRYGVYPKKSLGQNFLDDPNILLRFCDLAELNDSDQVLEIGPGIGALTAMLATNAKSVTAVELDDRLIPLLESELAGYENVLLIHGDILEQDPVELMGGTSYKVAANVPYYITGAILRQLLRPALKPSLMVLTVQKEVAERLTAKPGKMSILSTSVQLHGKVRIEFPIRAGSFWPKPAVNSAAVRFRAHANPLVSNDEQRAFMGLVKSGFSSRRKQLQKNLRAVVSDRELLQAAFASAGIDGTRRAQTLSVEEWLALFRALP